MIAKITGQKAQQRGIVGCYNQETSEPSTAKDIEMEQQVQAVESHTSSMYLCSS